MADTDLTVKIVFEQHLPARLKQRPDVVAKINAVYQFEVSGPEGGAWTVDCTAPGGQVTAGTHPQAGCTVHVVDRDLLGIIQGRVNPAMAFMTGKLRIQGDMGLAMKLQQILT